MPDSLPPGSAAVAAAGGPEPGYPTGVVLCALSGLSFGLLGAFGTLAFDAGDTVSQVLLLRFGTAAVVLWVVVGVTRRRVPRGRVLIQATVLGAVGYAVQALLYFSALQRLSVGLTSLLLYTFPVIVVGASLLAGRERLSWRAPVAALLAVGGVAACLGSSNARLDVVGIVLGLGAAVVYTGYYFGMDTLPAGADRLAVAALICTSAAAIHLVLGLAGSGLRAPSPSSAGWIGLLAIVSTVLPITLLLLGIRLAGPATAAVVSCAEPLTAVIVGAVFFDDPFGPPQLVGTAMVVAAVVLLQVRSKVVVNVPRDWSGHRARRSTFR